jgi:seryl-tRNA synthetase
MAKTPEILAWLADLLQLPERLDEVQVQLLGMELKLSKYTEEIAALNAETDNLSARIDAVLAKLETDDPAVEAELNAISARLRGLAADPENPVPAEGEPVEEPAPDQPAPVEGEQPQG